MLHITPFIKRVLAFCTMKVGDESEFSHSLELRFFHKLHKTIDAIDCCSVVNLSKRLNKRVEKSYEVGSKSQMIVSSCSSSQQVRLLKSILS